MPRKSPVISPRKCLECTLEYVPAGQRQKYCKHCSEIKQKEQAKKSAHKFYWGNKEYCDKRTRENYRNSKNRGSIEYTFYARKHRAKKQDITWEISLDDISVPDVCPVLLTPFKFKTPYAMSIDKIIPSLGYVKGNVQIMSCKANIMKSDATPEELIKFADWVYKNYKIN